MPYISSVYLIQNSLLEKIVSAYEHPTFASNMAFSNYLRDNDIFMYATNMDNFGHLINPENYNISLVRPEMFEIITNLKDWRDRYIHREYDDFISSKKNPLEVIKFLFFVISTVFKKVLVSLSRAKMCFGRLF